MLFSQVKQLGITIIIIIDKNDCTNVKLHFQVMSIENILEHGHAPCNLLNLAT